MISHFLSLTYFPSQGKGEEPLWTTAHSLQGPRAPRGWEHLGRRRRLYPASSDGGSFGEGWAEQRDLEAKSYRLSGIRIFFYSDVSSGH